MSKRFATVLAGLALGQSLVLATSPALAGNDKQAIELAEKALYEDYLNLEFKAAEKKLSKAISLCEADCNPEHLARVYRDMGVLQVAGLQDRAAGVEMFKKAITTNPSITLDSDLSTPDIDSAWQEAQASAGTGDSALSAAMRGSVDPEDAEPPPEEQDPMLRAMEEEEKRRAAEEQAKAAEPEPEPEPEPERAATDFKLDDEDCPPDFPGCDNGGGEVEETESEGPKHWLHVGYQMDFLLMDASTTACNGNTYQCYYGGGVYREPQPGVPIDGGLSTGGEGTISSGLVMATQRVLVGYDFAVTPSILLGARAGFAFGGGPQKNSAVTGQGKAFFPLHAELRGAYWFGGADNGSVRPYLQLSGGAAQVDGMVQVPIADRARYGQCTAEGRSQEAECYAQPVDAWKKAGTVFVSAGLGSLIAFGDQHGLLLEARVMQLLGAAGLGAGLQAGYSLGL